MNEQDHENAERRDWMSILAKAPADALSQAFAAVDLAPDYAWLRPPEHGAVMVRGRAGATGAPFNLGEMSVTRCSLRLADGTVGHAYVPGRDRDKARIAALCDALMQGPDAGAIRARILAPMTALMERAHTDRAARAAATKVDFFTMVRGED